MRVVSIAFMMIVLVAGCKKSEEISDVPEIEFVSVTPNPAVKYQDEIEITIHYRDGNGDLGENTPDIKNLFVTDSRNNVGYAFRIAQLAPDNASVIIQGNLKITLPPQGFLDDSHTTETTSYSIYVVDRAANKSNVVETSGLVINQ